MFWLFADRIVAMLTVHGGWLVPADNLQRWFDSRFPPGPHEIRDPHSSRAAALYTILYNRFATEADAADDYTCLIIDAGKLHQEESFVLVKVESGDFHATPKDVRRCFIDPGRSQRAQTVKKYLEDMGLSFEQNCVRWCQCPGKFRP